MIRFDKRDIADADRKISYCERAHRILCKRRDKSMELDELARAIEREIDVENVHRIENPAKGTPHFTRIRNTLYKQIPAIGGWKGTLVRTIGPMKRWMISTVEGKPASALRVRSSYQPALELAAEAGYSVDDVIVEGLWSLDASIKRRLTKKLKARLDALKAQRK